MSTAHYATTTLEATPAMLSIDKGIESTTHLVIQPTPHRIRQHNLALPPTLLLQRPPHPRNRPSRPSTTHKPIHPPRSLLPNLLCGPFCMRDEVCEVLELVEEEGAGRVGVGCCGCWSGRRGGGGGRTGRRSSRRGLGGNEQIRLSGSSIPCPCPSPSPSRPSVR